MKTTLTIILAVVSIALKAQGLPTILATNNTTGGIDITSSDGNAVANLTDGDNCGLSNNNGGININLFGTHIDHIKQVNINTQDSITFNATYVKKNGVEIATVNDISTLAAGNGCSVTTVGNNYTVSTTTPINVLTGNLTTTITTASIASDLTYSLEPNSIYVVRGHIRVGCNNTGGLKIGFNWPTGTVGSISTEARLAANNTNQWSLLVASGTLSNPVNTLNSNTGSFVINGMITTSGTGGNLEVIYTSQTSGQTSTLYQSGTYLEIVKKNP